MILLLCIYPFSCLFLPFFQALFLLRVAFFFCCSFVSRGVLVGSVGQVREAGNIW